jgi:hypothetical protein
MSGHEQEHPPRMISMNRPIWRAIPTRQATGDGRAFSLSELATRVRKEVSRRTPTATTSTDGTAFRLSCCRIRTFVAASRAFNRSALTAAGLGGDGTNPPGGCLPVTRAVWSVRLSPS